jgi:hypothetical protein
MLLEPDAEPLPVLGVVAADPLPLPVLGVVALDPLPLPVLGVVALDPLPLPLLVVAELALPEELDGELCFALDGSELLLPDELWASTGPAASTPPATSATRTLRETMLDSSSHALRGGVSPGFAHIHRSNGRATDPVSVGGAGTPRGRAKVSRSRPGVATWPDSCYPAVLDWRRCAVCASTEHARWVCDSG